MKLPVKALDNLHEKFCSLTGAANNDTPAIKNILLVGAKIKNDLLWKDDAYDLEWALYALKDLGISIHPDFGISIANIDPAQGGEDFLQGQYEADLILFCWIFNPQFPQHLKGITSESLWRKMALQRTGNHSISPNFLHKQKWLESAARSGAKVLVTRGMEGEINETYFEGDAFKVIKPRGEMGSIAVLLSVNYKGPLNPAVQETLCAAPVL